MCFELQYEDVSADTEGEYEAICEVDRSSPPQARFVLDTYIRNEAEGLRPCISRKIKEFVGAFNAIE